MNYYSTLRFWIWNLLQELQIWCKSEHIKKGTLKRILRVRPVTTKKIFSVNRSKLRKEEKSKEFHFSKDGFRCYLCGPQSQRPAVTSLYPALCTVHYFDNNVQLVQSSSSTLLPSSSCVPSAYHLNRETISKRTDWLCAKAFSQSVRTYVPLFAFSSSNACEIATANICPMAPSNISEQVASFIFFTLELSSISSL